MRWTDAPGTSSPVAETADVVGGVSGLTASHADSVSPGGTTDTSSRSSASSMASVDGLNTDDETAPHAHSLGNLQLKAPPIEHSDKDPRCSRTLHLVHRRARTDGNDEADARWCCFHQLGSLGEQMR